MIIYLYILLQRSFDSGHSTALWRLCFNNRGLNGPLSTVLCQTQSVSASSWAFNHLITQYTHNNMSRISHSSSVNAQKHDVNFRKSGNLNGALFGWNESPSTYPPRTLPMGHPVIRPSFASIAERCGRSLQTKDDGSLKLYIYIMYIFSPCTCIVAQAWWLHLAQAWGCSETILSHCRFT